MRETVKDPGRLAHILEAACLLRDKVPYSSLEAVREDKILFYGFSKLVEIIGEAAYKLTNEFRDSHPELPWRAIIGMRHVMVHGYYSISPEKLWATITDDIIDIIPIIENYLTEIEDRSAQ